MVMNDMKSTVPVHQDNAFWPHLFEPFKNFSHQVAGWFQPSAEAAQSEESYEISMELPGVEEGDIDVSLKDNVLTIKGEKSDSREEKNATYYFSERSYGSFQRSFRMPDDVDADGIKASYQDGVLNLVIPRTTKKQIDVQKIEISKS